MCQVSPGPRCSRHAQEQLQRSQRKLHTLREEYASLSKEIDQSINTTSYVSDEEVDGLRSRQQEIQDKIDNQIDKVSHDRDAFFTTPQGMKQIRSEIKRQTEAKNFRAVHTLNVRLEQAEQEHAHRVLADKIATRDRENIKRIASVTKTSEFAQTVQSERIRLKTREGQANKMLGNAQNTLEGLPKGSQQHTMMAINVTRLTREARAAKEARIRHEYQELEIGAGCSSPLTPVTQIRSAEVASSDHFLHLSSADFGIARDYFPRGALAKITDVRKDEVGNTILHLETGDQRVLYSDMKVFKKVTD